MTQEFHSSTHPPLPPTTEDEKLSWLRLLRSRRVGVATFYRLMAEHGSVVSALEALPNVAHAAGITSYTPFGEKPALAEIRAGKRLGARLVAIGEPDYPAPLMDIADAPPLLWLRGETAVLSRPMIAVVGARNASSLGQRMAKSLVSSLSEQGYVIVSGLARGIDTAAHKAALDGGTIAVLAGGIDVIYPTQNTALAVDILSTGLLISEQPVGLAPMARHFPRRNRLVSGLTQGVVLIEAAAKSGSLITARSALEQGREVLAVPGHPFDARASGCNMMIRDGARLVRGADDVIEALAPMVPQTTPHQAAQIPPAAPATEQRTLAETAALHQQILERLSPSPLAEDQLIRDIDAPANRVAPALLDLELDGRVARAAGGLLSLARPEKARAN